VTRTINYKNEEKTKQNTKPNFKTYKTAILEIIVIASKNN
jgi:hypothetical protein